MLDDPGTDSRYFVWYQEQTLVTSQAAMKEGMRKLNKALSSGGGSYVFHVLLFALGSFLLVYLWSKFR